MTAIGYARVSTADRDLAIQIAAPKRAGCTTSASTKGREALQAVLDFLREGDVLIVTRIDRLARSIGDLQDIVRAVKARRASLKATEQPIDTGTAAGKCFLDMWACSPSSRRTCAASASWRGSPRPRPRAFTRGDRSR